MNILKSLLLIGAVFAAVPAAAHSYVYDSGTVRIIYDPYRSYYSTHRYYEEPVYVYHGHSHRRPSREYRYDRQHVRQHRHHRDCGHGRRGRH